ncbi:MAG: hypothetical protein A3H28_10755 [Acidobacteria bacterium RIFCSPLOWO2_02_FULL_61_28]|nr:MAG: hypothetical protein A3H28_10755 [Acidobacteria bacterium RIFCSPLOWO2_02_FULL_61_28]
MSILTTKPFDKDYEALPEKIKTLTDQKPGLLLQNPRHPSLQVKKMNDPRNIWECRITLTYRFTFQIEAEIYVLRRIGTHDILKTP